MLPDPRLITTPADFARSLRVLRMRAGLSIRDAARALEQRSADAPSPSTLGGWFSGSHLPTPKLTKAVSELLILCGESDPGEVKEWQAALERVRSLPGPRPADSQSPYRGLAAYEPEHAEYFCGRQALVDALLVLVARQRAAGGMAIVVGPSGSGKSSLLRAGLIPALSRDGSSSARRGLHYLLFTPGRTPVKELARKLAGLTGRSAETIGKELLERPPACAGMLQSAPALRPGAGTDQVLIVVDQLEEVFAACDDHLQRRAFVQALRSLAVAKPRAPALVVLGMRSDFYTHALLTPELAPVLQDAQLVVGPMSDAELRQAITEPARRCNLSLEAGLVEVLLQDLAPSGARQPASAAHEAGALPLLSHALLATWKQAKGRTLTVGHYRATGSIRGAIAKTAEDTFAGLATPAQQEIARRLFVRLVQTGDDAADTRRRVLFAELMDGLTAAEAGQLQEVMDQFIVARLLTAHDTSVEITHEALLAAWPRMREWLDTDAAWLRLHRRLTAAAKAWQEAGHDPDNLYRGGALQVARERVGERGHRLELNRLEREFLGASVARHEAEQLAARRRVRRRYQLFALLTVLAMAATSVAVYARQLQVDGRHDRALALSRLVAGKADRLRGRDVPLAMQLALAGYRIAPTPEARSSLLNATAVPAATRLRSAFGSASSVVVSADGSMLAVGTMRGRVELWPLDTDGRPAPSGTTLAGPTGPIGALAMSPDGRTLAAGAESDGRVLLWSTADPSRPLAIGTLTGPRQGIRSVAISPDGRTMAAGSVDRRVYLWRLGRRPGDPSAALPLTVLAGPAQEVRAVAFTPDGRTLAAGGGDARVHLWNVADLGHPVALPVLTGPTSGILSIAISPDGRRLAAGTSTENNVYLWDLSDPARPEPEGPPLTGPASWVNTMTFSPDSRILAAGSSDSLLWLFDISSRQPTGRLPHPDPVIASTYRSDRALVTVADDGVVRNWNLPGPIITGAADSVFAVGFDASGRKLGIGAGATDNTLTVWDATDIQRPTPAGPALVNTPDAARFSGSGALTPNGSTFAVGSMDGSIQLWDIGDPARPTRLGRPARVASALVESVTISGDGDLLAVSSDDGAAHLVDIADPRDPRPLAALAGPVKDFVYQSAFSPDGRLVAVASRDHNVYVWDVSARANPKLLSKLDGFSDAAYSVAFSPDGRILAAGSADSTVLLWDVADPGRPVRLGRPVTGPVGYVYSVAFHPERNILAAGSTDSTVWLWDLTEPHHPDHLATLTGPAQGVLAVAFSPNGRTLAAGSHDHTVRMWNVDPEAAAAWVCATAGQAISEGEWRQYIPDHPYAPPCR